MKINDFYLVNVFTGEKARGNQSCVLLMDDISNTEGLSRIAADFNLPATTFLQRTESGYRVRWFAPMAEIGLCGHGTVAATWVLCQHHRVQKEVTFDYKSGQLKGYADNGVVAISGDLIPYKAQAIPQHVRTGFRGLAKEYYSSPNKQIVVFEKEEDIKSVDVDWDALRTSETFGYVITAPSSDHDCVSRVLLPHLPFLEDQATGSAHLLIAPYWSKRLEKTTINAFQASQRGGEMQCRVEGQSVQLHAQCEIFAKGTIT